MYSDFAPVIGLSFLFVIILALAFTAEDFSCAYTAKLMNTHYYYSPITDCMIETKSGFVPLKNYRDINQ